MGRQPVETASNVSQHGAMTEDQLLADMTALGSALDAAGLGPFVLKEGGATATGFAFSGALIPSAVARLLAAASNGHSAGGAG